MSFLNKLKDMFIYSGEKEEDTSDTKSEEIDLKEENFRLNLDNPLKRIKDIVHTSKESIKSRVTVKQKYVSRVTLNKLYTYIHIRIESKLNKGKPVEEGLLLYKRFLEDKVIDEDMYSDIDLLYINELVNVMKSLYVKDNLKNNNIDDIVTELCCNKNIFSILEILEIQQDFKFLSYFIDKSYIICGYSYSSDVNDINDIIQSLNKGVFKLEVENVIFIIVNELSSVISNDKDLDDKREYIVSKIKTFLKQYLIEHKDIINLIVNYNNLFNDNYNLNSNIENNDIEVNDPIEVLKNKFLNLYKPLIDLDNEDVCLSDLKSAIEDINSMVSSDDYILTKDEYKILKSLEERYNLMKER